MDPDHRFGAMRGDNRATYYFKSTDQGEPVKLGGRYIWLCISRE